VNPARLVLPALRWREDGGFAAEAETIAGGLERGVGGFIVFGGTREAVAALTADLRRRAGRPLLIGADLERGPGQQVAGLTELPPPAALAALNDPAAVRLAGAITGSEARSVGIDWIYAPDADLDLEPANPIVQTRSFGADPAAVGSLVGEWIEGCQTAGAAACAKHFPGHGRTRIDPHDRLPSVEVSRAVLEETDLVPFRAAVARDVGSIMTAHVVFPALDPARPATLSASILTRLRNELGFGGAIVSDAMMMGALKEGWGPGQAGLAALRAGVDLLLYPDSPWETIAAIERAMAVEPAVRARVSAALDRYEGLVRRVAGPAEPADLERNAATAADLADRLLATGPAVTLRPPLELLVVDDDQDGAYPASPNDYLARSLGLPQGSGGSLVVLAFAEPRASKGRGGFGPRSLELLRGPAAGAALIVLFAHPRLEAELPVGVPVLRAWHRQRLMQEAAARWIRGRVL
jgi:beta-glucosidase